ncbi:hypothetical protein E4T56_gene13031 [Termitomyces sp. T112]|nr:hypothetical protein E4T56_gene13031 [Termitomyces sp. T112]
MLLTELTTKPTQRPKLSSRPHSKPPVTSPQNTESPTHCLYSRSRPTTQGSLMCSARRRIRHWYLYAFDTKDRSRRSCLDRRHCNVQRDGKRHIQVPEMDDRRCMIALVGTHTNVRCIVSRNEDEDEDVGNPEWFTNHLMSIAGPCSIDILNGLQIISNIYQWTL